MTRFNRWIADHPWPTIALFLLATCFFAVRLPQLHIDVDVEAMLPQDHPEFVYKRWAVDYFGLVEPAVVIIVNDGPDGVFTPETLQLVEFVSERMMALEGIESGELVSLSEIDDITADGDTLLVDPFFDIAPTTPDGARAIRDAVFDNPMMVGSIVSRDGKATQVIGEMVAGVDKLALYTELQALVAGAPVTTETIAIAGRPVIESEIGQVARADLRVMFPLVVTVAALVLWLTMRCVRGVVLPLLVVISSVLWTLGLMAWTGGTFYALSNTMPIILIPIGIADGIHVLHDFMIRVARRPEIDAREAAFETMQEMTPPVVMTSVTTILGVGSLAVSAVASIRSFGIYTGLGVLAAMVFSLTLLPALLAVLPLPRRAAQRVAHTVGRTGGPVARFLDGLTPIITRRPTLTVAAGLVVLLIGAAGLPRVFIDGSLVQNFPPDNPVKLADAALIEHFGGSQPVEIVLDGGSDDAWKQPELLRAVGRYQDRLETDGLLAETRSIVDYIRRMNAVMNPDDADGYRVPDSAELIAQYLLLYAVSGDPGDLDDVVDYNYRQANIRTRSASDHSPELARVFTLVDEQAEAMLAGHGIDVHGSGVARTSHMFMQLILAGQVLSLALALALVVLATGAMMGSIVAGLFAVLPVLIATVLNFGVLGWLGSPLGVTTALMSALGIGIGVDYAIHFLVRYRRARRSDADPDAAMHETLSTTGVAILYNATVVMAGFVVLATSQFLPNRVLGYLVSLNMLVCFAATVTVVAAALHRLQPAFTGRAAIEDTDGSEARLAARD